MIAIAWFEFRTRLKRLSTWIYCGMFAAMAALWMAAAGGAFAEANIVFSSDKVFINAPYALAQTIDLLGFFGVIVVAAVMGRAVQQDFEYQSFHFFYTSPITKRDYLLGRYLGALGTLVVIFSGIVAGIVLGTHWPGIDASRIGPWSVQAMVAPYLTTLIPNMIFLGGCFFGMAALTRRMLPTYVAGVVIFVGYLLSNRLLADIDNKTLAALIDPIGIAATSLITRYWSLSDKNTRMVPIVGELLWNRALWLTVGLALFGFCYARFRMSYAPAERRRAGKVVEDLPVATRAAPVAAPSPAVDTSALAYLRQLPGLTLLYARETLKNIYFGVIVLSGVLFLLGNAKVLGSFFGTNTYPVTYQVLEFTSGTFSLFMLIITTLYAGELVWRERDARLAQITDSLPTPTWLPFMAKLFTLLALQAMLQGVVLLCGVLIQLINGYTRFELGHYFYHLFALQLPEYWMTAALALTVHVVVNQKYLGHFLVVAYYLVAIMLSSFGYEHFLYHFGRSPVVPYSDMNGYGHFIPAVRWFQLYWGAAAILLLVLARLAWVRGMDTGAGVRLAIARRRWSGGLILTALAAAFTFAASGAWIYYNTNVLNPYRNEFATEELRAQYEKLYKGLEKNPQPKITGVKVAVDIFPREHRVRFQGTYTLANKSAAPIPELYVNVQEQAEIRRMDGSIPLRLADGRRELNFYRYAFARPLAPGESLTLAFDLEYAAHGFTNRGASRTVVDNGTFVNSGFLPFVGYQDRMELSEDRERGKHGLQPKERMPDLDDLAARGRNYVSSDADWIDFEATVSTEADQVALAPGYLQREWTQDGRRYFSYKMDTRILNFYAFLSARYAVYRDAWQHEGVALPIEIFYQPGHEYNLQRMAEGVKDSLDYYTKNFSPYQHRQVRILEFPRYESFAQSFPNTIPYSEGIGFIAQVKPDDPKDIDYPYYVTAHEVAHQWWAHQVIGANVQGATMLSETLAQYSALMVMKHKYGDAQMRRFLKYELDRYLLSRGSERKKELPLYRNENQAYLHYRKGSVVMYDLQDAIGEDNVNRALASYISKVAFQEPPYTTSRELLAEFRAVTPEDYQYLITDLFETITLYENRAVSAVSRSLPGGQYEVTLKASAKKLRAEADGTQHEVPMDDWVDIGVFDDKEAPLYLKKHRVRSGETTLTLVVSGKPAKAGIDPINKLVDRRSDDNVVSVSGGS